MIIEVGTDAESLSRVEQMAEEFGINSSDAAVPGLDIVILAHISKTLKFDYKFDRCRRRLAFHSDTKTTRVRAFGIDRKSDEQVVERMRLRRQVDLADYKSPDDFVVELRSDSVHDQLILAQDPSTRQPSRDGRPCPGKAPPWIGISLSASSAFPCSYSM